MLSEEKSVLFGPAVEVPQFDKRRPFPAPSKAVYARIF
jgi:hypothetical protein